MRNAFLACLFLLACLVVLPGSALLAQQSLNNDAVIKLVKAGLSEDLIVTTINSSPGTYDTSANGLIALKKAGATDKVVAAIVLKASGASAAQPSTPAASPAASPTTIGNTAIGGTASASA